MTRILRIALAGLMLCSGTWPLADAAAQTAKKEPVVVRLGHRVYVSVIDPVYTQSHGTRDHAFLIYDQLFGVDNKMQPHPQMVDTWTRSADGLVYTFTLRDGLKFHDGTDVTAADCIASIKRWAQVAEMGKLILDRLSAIEARDKKTFVIRLSRPFGLLIDALASPDGTVLFIMPERIAGSTPPDKQITDMTGSGPFKVKERVVNSHTVYEKFTDYKPRPEPANGLSGGKVVKMDLLEWRGMPDENTRMAALLAGEVDYVHQPPLTLVSAYQKDPNVVVKLVMLNGQQGYIQFNHLLPPFDNKKVRQAVAWCLNQKEFIKTIFGESEFVKESYSIYGNGSPLYTQDGTEALKGTNCEKSKQLLKEAGYDGRSVTLLDVTVAFPGHAGALSIAAALRKAGLNVSVVPLDSSTKVQRLFVQKPPSEGGWNIHTSGQTLVGIGSPLTHPYIQAGERVGCAKKGQPGWPCSPELGRLIDAFAEEPDAAKRKELARQIQVMALDHVAYLYYSEYFEPAAMRKELKGVLEAPIPVFWGMTK
jgi:peptide/nickel transport system substrate-binding protein